MTPPTSAAVASKLATFFIETSRDVPRNYRGAKMPPSDLQVGKRPYHAGNVSRQKKSCRLLLLPRGRNTCRREPVTRSPRRRKGNSGKEFDQSYDQIQVKAHQDAVALFEAYAKGGDENELERLTSWLG